MGAIARRPPTPNVDEQQIGLTARDHVRNLRGLGGSKADTARSPSVLSELTIECENLSIQLESEQRCGRYRGARLKAPLTN